MRRETRKIIRCEKWIQFEKTKPEPGESNKKRTLMEKQVCDATMINNRQGFRDASIRPRKALLERFSANFFDRDGNLFEVGMTSSPFEHFHVARNLIFFLYFHPLRATLSSFRYDKSELNSIFHLAPRLLIMMMTLMMYLFFACNIWAAQFFICFFHRHFSSANKRRCDDEKNEKSAVELKRKEPNDI